MKEDRTESLGDFVLEGDIGEGGFFKVKRGSHRDLGRKVAIKLPKDRDQFDRIKLDASILAKVGHHRHIVELYQADLESVPPYEVVELCDSSIKEELEGKEPIDWRQATRWTAELLDALAFVHSEEMVHGDVKPSNILLRDGHVKLNDFNVSAVADPSAYMKSMVQSASLARFGDQPRGLEGTIMYWTPEQRGGNLPTQKSDVHQAGQVLYEMLAGKMFLDRDGPISGNGLPQWLDDVIGRATHSNPEERCSANEMRRDLLKGLDGKLDGPSKTHRLKKGAGSALRKLGKGSLIGLKYAALTATAPLWGPVWAVKTVSERDCSDGLLTTMAFIAAAGWYVGGPIALLNAYENRREDQTRAIVSEYAQSAPKNLSLAYMANGNALRVLPVRNIVDENPVFEEIILPATPNKILGVVDRNFFYLGSENIKDGDSPEQSSPQIYNVDVGSATITPMIDYGNENSRWVGGKTVQESHLIKDAETAHPVVKIDGYWYAINGGSLDRQSKFTYSFVTPREILPESNFRVEKSDKGWIQIVRGENFWGDLELFVGSEPQLFYQSDK
ncbi:MAG: serine/threonine protein kinase [Nanoarchaeota archaeon]|nr:serine/threonine protein kinase [Nanoarchaeota archaeon]MBU1103438.1 serine/threonine protein kinase [Nanoarchaeota archaeon]